MCAMTYVELAVVPNPMAKSFFAPPRVSLVSFTPLISRTVLRGRIIIPNINPKALCGDSTTGGLSSVVTLP